MENKKSIVAMGNRLCPVCNKIHDRGAVILLAKNLNKGFDDNKKPIIGYKLCEEHYKEDYIACIFGNPIDTNSFER